MAQYGFELLDVRPAPQGRMRGVIVLAHRVLETINRIGWAVDGVQVAFVDSAYLCVSENVTSP
jgi:hypothetical protein